MKLTVIGGGSTYLPELVEGLALRHDAFPVSQLWLVDTPLGEERMAVTAALAERMLRKAGLAGRVTITCTTSRPAALEGAAFVINQFRVGGTAARARDERVPLRYGVIGQETTGPGGFAQALRNIPVALEVAREMEVLCPEAFLLNFTNPAGMVTEALTRYTAINTVGLCNVPITLHKTIAALLEVDPARVRLQVSGLNHLSWVERIYLDGEEVTARVLAAPQIWQLASAGLPGVTPARAGALLQDLGMLPSPYLRYYYFTPQALRDQRAQARGAGTRAEEVARIEEELFRLYRDPALDEKPPQLSLRGGAFYAEAAMGLLAALHGGEEPSLQVLNVVNGSRFPELPPQAVVETDCLVARGRVYTEGSRPLPAAVRGLVQQVKAYEELAVRAAAEGDSRLAFLALLNHPLVPGAVTARRLLRDILREHGPSLLQFKKT